METLANAPVIRFDSPQDWEHTLNKVNRYAICHRIETAKKPDTRRARIEKFIAMLAANEKLYP